MATEDDDIRDREVWVDVAHHWYSIACSGPTESTIYQLSNSPGLEILVSPKLIRRPYVPIRSKIQHKFVFSFTG